MVTIRKMKAGEEKQVQRIGQKAFKVIESCMLPIPKEAMVAVEDEQIVGGIILKYIKDGDKKIGYFEDAFVAPGYQSKGIGRKLYKETTDYLWEQGCDALTALVKDDNVGSWQLFLDNGFKRVTIREGIRQLGFSAMLKQYFFTPLWAASGMEFYLSVKGQEVSSKQVHTLPQLALFLLLNTLFAFIGHFSQGGKLNPFFMSYFVFLAASAAVGYIGTLFSKTKWHFRLNSGGGVVVAILHFITIFPMWGNWYPLEYKKEAEFRKAMGIQALCVWVFILALTIGTFFLSHETGFFRGMQQTGGIYLFYEVLNFYPFECFGAKRIYAWKKEGYYILAGISIAVLIFEKFF